MKKIYIGFVLSILTGIASTAHASSLKCNIQPSKSLGSFELNPKFETSSSPINQLGDAEIKNISCELVERYDGEEYYDFFKNLKYSASVKAGKVKITLSYYKDPSSSSTTSVFGSGSSAEMSLYFDRSVTGPHSPDVGLRISCKVVH